MCISFIAIEQRDCYELLYFLIVFLFRTSVRSYNRWDIAIPALRVYCGLLFVCALNGVLEAYMHAKSDAQWLRINAGFQFANFAILVGAAALLRSHGPIALVCANAASMAARTLVAAGFAYRQGSLAKKDLALS